MYSQDQISNRAVFLVSTGWAGFSGALFFWIAGATGVLSFPYATSIFVALVLISAPVTGLISVRYIDRMRKKRNL